ncbi:MAG TPA: hypothetical protein VFR18_09970 [Terriglobia bacterium]|nr:hypothetical protein [Terriglobia bacterium]
MNARGAAVFLIVSVLAVSSLIAWAQKGDLTHGQDGTATAFVDFGVLPTAPIGPPPCLQTGAIGGPADPCSYLIHHLTPEEVTVAKDGEVTFQIHGGGHAMAIYEVSKDTTRNQVGQFLCPGEDPGTISNPMLHPCNLNAANANNAHIVSDGHGDIVIVASPNVTNAHPDNRIWYVPGRLMSAGGIQFLNGGTIPAGPTSNGQLITYRFLKTGRYLVICMNRVHGLNDWMFGFVNVVGEAKNK